MNGRLENEIKKEKQIDNILDTLPNYITEWNCFMASSDMSPASRLDFIRKIRRFLCSINQKVDNVLISEITKINVDKYLSSITKKNINGNIQETSDSYKQSVWSCLNNFFGFLVEYEYIEKNPINMKKKPKNNDLYRINSNRIRLTGRDFKDILCSVENGVGTQKSKTRQEKWQTRDMCIFLLLMTTGMRETALTQINIGDIDFINHKLTIEDKGDKIHTYYLNDKTMNTINDWLEVRKLYFPNIKTDALIISYMGDRMSSKGIVKIVDKYCMDALGKHISPHKFRAGFCSIMYEESKDIEKVRRMVGHSNISTTQRYIVTDNAERKESSNIMERILLV